MNTSRTAVLTLALALAGFGAHAQTTTTPPPTTTPPAATPTSPPAPTAAPGTEMAQPPVSDERKSDLEGEDERFLENAIQGSHAEVLGSQLALEKTENSDVRAFAEMMIADHQKMIQEADALANQKNMTAPTGPSVLQSTEITALKALSGGAFDAMYVNRIGVAAHESTVEMFEEASQNAQDPDVKEMATKTLPKLREHLEAARALNEKQEKQ